MTLTQILQKIKSVFYTKAEIDSMGGGSSLDTTIKSKASDSDVVHKSGNEVIVGEKTFNSSIVSTTSSGACILRNSFMNLWGLSNTIILRQFDDNGNLIDFTIDRQRDVCLPNGSLGTSTTKWKSINGVNPGALSFPTYCYDIDSTNWKLDGTSFRIIFPTTTYTYGYLSIIAICNSSSDYGRVYDENNRIGNCTTAIYDGSNFVVSLLIPITNVNNSIVCALKVKSVYSSRFFKCQGNV